MVVIISKIDVEWNDAFKGYIPSKFVFAHGGLYTCEIGLPLLS
jgi:metal iron transporter